MNKNNQIICVISSNLFLNRDLTRITFSCHGICDKTIETHPQTWRNDLLTVPVPVIATLMDQPQPVYLYSNCSSHLCCFCWFNIYSNKCVRHTHKKTSLIKHNIFPYRETTEVVLTCLCSWGCIMGGYCCPLSLGWAVAIRPWGGPGIRMWWEEGYMGGPGPPFIPPGPLGSCCILISLGGCSKL